VGGTGAGFTANTLAVLPIEPLAHPTGRASDRSHCICFKAVRRQTKKEKTEAVRKVIRRVMFKVFPDVILEDPKLRELYRLEIQESTDISARVSTRSDCVTRKSVRRTRG
jgi:hypothetical protein